MSLNETLSATLKHELSSLMDVTAEKKREKRENNEVKFVIGSILYLIISLCNAGPAGHIASASKVQRSI